MPNVIMQSVMAPFGNTPEKAEIGKKLQGVSKIELIEQKNGVRNGAKTITITTLSLLTFGTTLSITTLGKTVSVVYAEGRKNARYGNGTAHFENCEQLE